MPMSLRRLIRSTDTGVLLASALATLLLLLGFWLTQPMQQKMHEATLARLALLQTDQSRLGEAVLQHNFNLNINYDDVNALMQRLQATNAALLASPVAKSGRQNNAQPNAFAHQLQQVQAQLQAKAELLERFKSQNAELKNSLHYLPRARDELSQILRKKSQLLNALDALFQQVLLERVRGGLLDRAATNLWLSQLRQLLARLPQAQQARWKTFLRHVEHIDTLTANMPQLMAQLTSTADNQALTRSYYAVYASQQKAARLYRLGLLAVALALIAFAVHSVLRMRHQAQRLRLGASVFAHASEGITITDPQGHILDVNPSFSRLTGYSAEEAIGNNSRLLQSGRQDAAFYQRMWQALQTQLCWSGEIWNRRKSGELYPEWLSIQAVTEPLPGGGNKVTHYIATFSDLTQRKRDESEIYRLANFDPLTGLANRRLLLERLQLELARHDAPMCALLAFNLDKFRQVNDLHGSAAGDAWLHTVGETLCAAVSKSNTVARLSGDDFMVLLTELGADPDAAAHNAYQQAEGLRTALAALTLQTGQDQPLSARAGVAMSWRGADADTLMGHAGSALALAKSDGGNVTRFFEPELQARLLARAQLEIELRSALHENQFLLYYQAQTAQDGMANGAEVLVRWQHPKRGLVSPAEFIPICEQTGLIRPLGLWILEQACAVLAQWVSEPEHAELQLAVNVSALQLADATFVDQVRDTLVRTKAPVQRLKLEITESMLLTDVDVIIARLQALRALGVRFSLDDFGTGYSSLQYLRRLPLHQIKIDQSFVRDLTANESTQVIVRTIIVMARSLGLAVIAEGVETVAQRDALLRLGCDQFQGYLYAQPVPLATFEALVRAAPLNA